MSNKLFQKQWQDFEKSVIPPNAPAVQRQEMRRAFYAGASAMFNLTRKLGDEDVDEDEAVLVLEGLEQELAEFLSLIGVRY